MEKVCEYMLQKGLKEIAPTKDYRRFLNVNNGLIYFVHSNGRVWCGKNFSKSIYLKNFKEKLK